MIIAKRIRLLTSLLVLLTFVGLSPLAVSQVLTPPEPEPISIDQFVVKVTTREASPFSGVISGGGHGTGFITKIDPDTGIITIYTNRHVVQSTPFTAQNVVVEVTNGENLPEVVPAKVVYISRLLDFAVLEVNKSDLRETGAKVRAAALPPENHPFFEFIKNLSAIQRRMAIALGNPLMSEQVATEGIVTGRMSSISDGDYIQTQAPINPGNSGGPLIDAQTGIVLGINTSIIEGANNVGFAFPIGEVIEDHQAFLNDPSVALAKAPPITFALLGMDKIHLLGIDTIIGQRYPTLISKTKALIQITDAKPDGSSGFRTGDIILSVEGELIGTQYFDYRKIIQRQDKVTVEVVRNGKIETLTQKYPVEKTRRMREAANFAIVSGLLFVQNSPLEVWKSTGSGGITSVVQVVGTAMEDPELAFSGQQAVPPPGSMVVGVNINGNDYPVKTLLDLKLALRANPTAKAMRLDVRMALWIENAQGQPQKAVSPQGGQLISGTVSTHVIPITKVYTVSDFSLERFRQQFSFNPTAAESRNLKQWIESSQIQRQHGFGSASTPTSCAEAVAN